MSMRRIMARSVMAAFVAILSWASPALAHGAPGCSNDRAVRSREVLFRNGAGVLSGIVVSPSSGGHHPAMLFLYGSSTAPRDGRGLFPPLWCTLARRGVVTLSWDRPGAGRSTGDAQALDWLAGDRATEAQSALAFARSQPDIDSHDIGLLGISQAGWIIPQIIRREPSVSRVVMLSAPVGTVWDQTKYIVDRHLEISGYRADERNEVREAFIKIETLLRAGKKYEAYCDLIAKYQTTPWMKGVKQLPQGDYFHLSAEEFALELRDAAHDRPTDLAAITMPVLAVYGDHDLNVDPTLGAAAFTAKRSSNSNVSVLIIPGADHFMRYAPNRWPLDRPAATPSLNSLVVAPVVKELISVLGGWIDSPPTTTRAAN